MFLVYIVIFAICCALLYFSGEWLVSGLIKVARFLGWREFVVAFITMAFASSLPNFFVGVNSALHGVPQLSFGDVVGGSVVDLTLVIALTVLISKRIVPVEGKVVKTSTFFTVVVALIPLVLILDGVLSRGDALILFLILAFYFYWIFSRDDRYKKTYNDSDNQVIKEFKTFLRALAKIVLASLLLLLAAEGIVRSAIFFAGALGLSLAIIGILIVGLGNCLPELYFSIISARAGKPQMILGNLMGAIIIPSTLVLGTVALLRPIEITDFSSFTIGRAFLLISALVFFVSVRSGQKVTKKEAFILLSVYLLFLFVEILAR